jgi:hypothetical protein
VAFTAGEELRIKFDIVKAFGDTAKSYIQISSAALALPILFTQAILGKNAAENGLRSVGVPSTLYGAWASFLLAIGFGLIYQWSSVRRLWDELHTMQRTDENVSKPGFRRSWWVVHFDKLNLSLFYGGMVMFFFAGILLFVFFASTLLLARPIVKVVPVSIESQAPSQKLTSLSEDKPIAVKVAPVDVNKDRADYVYIAASLLLTLLTLIIAGIAWKQASSAQLSAQAVINAERAWILVEGIRPQNIGAALERQTNLAVPLFAQLRNYGKTPAWIMESSCKFVRIEGQTISGPLDYGESVSAGDGYALPPNDGGFPVFAQPTPLLSAVDVERIRLGQISVFLYGLMKYRSVFDSLSIRETYFCLQLRVVGQVEMWQSSGPDGANRYT